MRSAAIRRIFLYTIIVFGCIWIYTFRSTNTLFIRRQSWALKEISSDDMSVSAYNDMELYLRMTASYPLLNELYKSVLVQSMQYFWPDITSMVVVLDNEKFVDHEFGNAINKTFPFPRICFMDDLKILSGRAKDRMQRDLFYPDLCTSKKYVAFVDTDTMLISRMVPELLFDGGKPIIIGVYGKVVNTLYNTIAQATAKLFKTKEVIRCMSYFPVVMKVEHLVELRSYLEKLHNIPFDELFLQIGPYDFCSFHMMCQYVWMFHRSEYRFHLQLQTIGFLSPAREGLIYYIRSLTDEQTTPVARTCAHYKYIDDPWRDQETYREILRSSICFNGGFEICPENCKSFNKSSLREDLFTFGPAIRWTWDSRCFDAQVRHDEYVKKYADLEYSNIILRACYEVDSLNLSLSKRRRLQKI